MTSIYSLANQHPLPVPPNTKNNNNGGSTATATIKDKINIYNNGAGTLSTSSATNIKASNWPSTSKTTQNNNNDTPTKNFVLGATTTSLNSKKKSPPSLPPRPTTVNNNQATTRSNDEPADSKLINKKKSLVGSLGFSSASAAKLAFPAKSRQSSYNSNNKDENGEQSSANKIGDSPRSNSSRFTTLESIQRRASSITQEVSRRTSVMTVFRPKKSSTVETQKPLLSKKSDVNIGQNGSSRQLSARLSYARTTSEQTLARAGRKKSENLFTKQEQRSIRLAATEAKIIWDDDNSRTSDDTSIVSDEDGKSKRSTLVEVQNMYKDNHGQNFEMINPATSLHSSFTNGGGSIPDHQFGMLIFTESRGHTVIEEEEED